MTRTRALSSHNLKSEGYVQSARPAAASGSDSDRRHSQCSEPGDLVLVAGVQRMAVEPRITGGMEFGYVWVSRTVSVQARLTGPPSGGERQCTKPGGRLASRLLAMDGSRTTVNG